MRFVGDCVAYVVAETDHEPLVANVDSAAACEPGTAAVWDDCPDNISNLFELGDKATVDATFERAPHSEYVMETYLISRIARVAAST